MPNFLGMPLEQSATALVQYYCKDNFVCTDTTIINGGVSIDIKVETFFTERALVRDCCRIYMNIARSLFTNNNAQTLVINFDTPGRDIYGNEITVRAMEIFITRDTAKKINYDYMLQNLVTSTYTFLRATDRHYVHSDLKNGVY
jgi:nucleosome binding factor SPN SPT16 subunit